VAFERHRDWFFVRINDGTCGWRLRCARQDRVLAWSYANWDDLRASLVCGETYAPGSAWLGVWRNCMLPSERNVILYGTLPNICEYFCHPYAIPHLPGTLQHRDTSANWHLASIKMIVQQCTLTQISLAVSRKVDWIWTTGNRASAPGGY